MQINISDRGAFILALVGLLVAAVVFAPEQVANVLDSASNALQEVA